MPFKPHPDNPDLVIYTPNEYWIPKQWQGLTDIDTHVLKMNYDKVKVVYTDHAEDLTVLGQDVDVNGLINATVEKLKELNT